MAHVQRTIPPVPTDIPTEGKHIVYEAEDSYVMYLDRRLVGVARTHDEADTTLDELVCEIEHQTAVTTADIEAERDAQRAGEWVV